MAYSDDQIIDALEKTGGNQAAAARALGCSRRTVWQRIQDSDVVKQKYDSVNEANLDKAENKLMEQVQEGYFPAIKFYLRTKGRSRGYGDRQEVEHSGNLNFQIQDVDAEGNPIS